MRILKLLMCLALVALVSCTTGCAKENVKQALDNIHGDCVRHYQGAVGGVAGTVTMTFDINCAPEGKAPAPAAAPPKQQ